MGQIIIQAETVLDARAEDVYATIADYKHSHPQILPSKSMYDLRVEQGGYGAGTVMRFKVKVLGVEQSAYQKVSEPEPGHILQEQDIDSPRNLTTTFTVTPTEDGAHARVAIHTVMNASRGPQGWLEGKLLPRALTPVYYEELQKLETVARARGATPMGK